MREHRGPATFVRRLLAYALLAAVAALANGHQNTATQRITIRIDPVQVFAAASDWHTISEQIGETGDTVVTAHTSYGITTNVEGTVIMAMLGAAPPSGVTVELLLESSIGQSLGWVDLDFVALSPLVTGVKGNEFNTAFVRFTVPAGMPTEGMQIPIYYHVQ